MIGGLSAAFGALKLASAGAPAVLRPLMDPRVLIILAAFALGAKSCDKYHDYLGARAELAAAKTRIKHETEQRKLAQRQAQERATQLEKLEQQTNAADQALDTAGTPECPCVYDPAYIELHKQIGK